MLRREPSRSSHESGEAPARILSSVSFLKPRPRRYSRARVPGAVQRLCEKCWAAASSRASISSRALRSGPPSKRFSGTVTPKRRAIISTASGKATRSWSMANLKTSPPSPQPKQWKRGGSERTLNDGVFS